MGELKAIWLKRSRRGPMDPVETAELDVDRGLAGDANPDWRGGAYATVLSDGALRVGQAVAWEEA